MIVRRAVLIAVAVLLPALCVWAGEEAVSLEEDVRRAAVAMKAELDEHFIVTAAGLFAVAGDLDRDKLDRVRKDTIEGAATALWNDFFEVKPDRAIRIYLFNGSKSYEKWVRKLTGQEPGTPYGFYIPGRRSMMMNIASGGGTLVHELTHALTHADFADCPTWLFEGMGSLFEQCSFTADGHIRGHVNWRLPVLRKSGFLPLEELMSMTDADFRGEGQAGHYANARYLCFYLQENGLLGTFYKAFRKAHKAGEDDTGWATFKTVIGQPPEQFEAAWHEWVKTLRWKRP